MAKKKLTKLEQIGIVVMVGIVGMFFYLKLVYDPTIKEYSTVQKKWVKLTKDVAKLKDEEVTARGIENLKKRLKEVKSGLRKAESCLVKDASKADDLMISLLGLAEENSLEVKSYKSLDLTMVKEIIKTLLYKRKYYDIMIEGRYENFIVFLRKIGSLQQLVTVEKIDIKNKANVEGGNLEIALLLSI